MGGGGIFLKIGERTRDLEIRGTGSVYVKSGIDPCKEVPKKKNI